MQSVNNLSREEIIEYYTPDTLKLLDYLKWLEVNSGNVAESFYKGEGIENSSMPVPVYDSTLLNFIKTAKTTCYMNRNYIYTYSRERMKGAKDELHVIDLCTLQDMGVLGDILSQYVIKGETRGAVWSDGLRSGVYLALLQKMKELLEIHDRR